MNRITITAGIGEDRNGQPITPERRGAALANIRASFARLFGGYTELAAMGGWVNPDGELVTEPALRWVMVADDAGRADDAAELARRALNQAAVVLEVETIAARFVSAPEPVTVSA